MATDDTVFGDFPISSSCATLPAGPPVVLYDFEPGADGSYSIQAAIVAWQVGGGSARYFLAMNWTMNAGALDVDGSVFSSPNGSLAPGGLTVDVSGGKGRVLVTGTAGEALLWRLRGVRFDLTI